MQKLPSVRRRGQVVDERAGDRLTRGGSSDSELNDWQVNPAGPSSVTAVTTGPAALVERTLEAGAHLREHVAIGLDENRKGGK